MSSESGNLFNYVFPQRCYSSYRDHAVSLSHLSTNRCMELTSKHMFSTCLSLTLSKFVISPKGFCCVSDCSTS